MAARNSKKVIIVLLLSYVFVWLVLFRLLYNLFTLTFLFRFLPVIGPE